MDVLTWRKTPSYYYMTAIETCHLAVKAVLRCISLHFIVSKSQRKVFALMACNLGEYLGCFCHQSCIVAQSQIKHILRFQVHFF